MDSEKSISVSFLASDLSSLKTLLGSSFQIEAVAGSDCNFKATKTKDVKLVLPRPDNTTTFPTVLKGLTMTISEDGGTYTFTSAGVEVLVLNSKGWTSKTPEVKSVDFPSLKDTKNREKAFSALKDHSSGLFTSAPAKERIASGLLSVLPTLKSKFEKDIGYINSSFSFPDFDYLADLSILGLNPVRMGDMDGAYFFLPRLAESKLRELMNDLEIPIPEFTTKKGDINTIKNCFILTMRIVQYLVETGFEKNIVVFVDLNSGNRGNDESVFTCLEFLDSANWRVQVTRVGSKIQGHFCLKFIPTGKADEGTSSYLEAALCGILVQVYSYLSTGRVQCSVTYEKDVGSVKLVKRHQLVFPGESMFSPEAKVAEKPKKVDLFAALDEEEDFSDAEQDSIPETESVKGKVSPAPAAPAVDVKVAGKKNTLVPPIAKKNVSKAKDSFGSDDDTFEPTPPKASKFQKKQIQFED